MHERRNAMIVVLLLAVIADALAEGRTLDVCAACHPDATCDDVPDGPGKVCNCKYGFVGNGRTICVDKDECRIASVSKICGQHTSCHNTYGSYYCTCSTGYSPSNNMAVFIPNDGTYCQDIDECSITGLCGDGGQCRNLDGSFECSCRPGYRVHNGVEPFHPHTDKASCKLVDCGRPGSLEDAVLQTYNGTTYGSVATFVCDKGFMWRSGENSSVCGADGKWSGASMVCEDVDECSITGLCGDGGQCGNLDGSFECSCRPGYRVHNGVEPFHPHTDKASCKLVDCGRPGSLEDAVLQTYSGTTYGSVATFVCDEGFMWRSGENSSVCGDDGKWSGASMVCEAKCGPVPFLANSEVVWHNRSVVIHRCVDGYHSWRGSNVSVCGSAGLWQEATLRCIETKPPINNLLLLDEKCLSWKAEKYEEDTEVYKVTYVGSRDYQRSFHDKRKHFLSSKTDQLELCLNLLPVTNYSISVTAVSARFTATITTNTSLPAPPAPVVYYREFETPVPTLRLHRTPDTLDPISLYQVFVLPVEGLMIFDCPSPASSGPSSKMRPSPEYITAQFDVRHVGAEMDFTVGDGLYYGGFFNVPLENGRNYYIILRVASQWKTALKSTCVLWAKVRGTSYIVQVSSLSAAASVGGIGLVILGGYSFTKFLRRFLFP